MNGVQKPSPAQVYEEYLVPGIHARWAPVLLKHAAPKSGENALDVACGTGVVARQLAPVLGEGGRIVASDINPDMLAVGQSLPQPSGARIEWRQAAADNLPDGPFDLLLCQQGLQFFPDKPASAKEMLRTLKPGGRIALNVFQGLEKQGLYKDLFASVARHLGKQTGEIAAPFSFGDPSDLRDLLTDAGFSSVEVHDEACTVSFPSPERFLALTVLAAASVLPEFGTDQQARDDLVEGVRQDVAASIDRYTAGDRVSFPTHANIAIAFA